MSADLLTQLREHTPWPWDTQWVCRGCGTARTLEPPLRYCPIRRAAEVALRAAGVPEAVWYDGLPEVRTPERRATCTAVVAAHEDCPRCVAGECRPGQLARDYIEWDARLTKDDVWVAKWRAGS